MAGRSSRLSPNDAACSSRAPSVARGARALADRYGLNPKTVAKWRARTSTADAPMGPRRPRSTVLTEAEEAIVVEFRRRTLLPLDDVLGCLREAIPKLSRSALHRCLVRHGISRLPQDEEKASKRRRFAETAIGYVHIDVCELRLAEGRLHMFLAIDRVSKFVHVAFLDADTKANGAAFLREVVAVFPYRLHTVLTDNGMAFADLPKNRGALTRRSRRSSAATSSTASATSTASPTSQGHAAAGDRRAHRGPPGGAQGPEGGGTLHRSRHRAGIPGAGQGRRMRSARSMRRVS